MKNLLRPACGLLLAFTAVTGLAYPLLITGLAHVLFPAQANGSLIYHNGKPIGSKLIGQNFTNPGYFWGRISQTGQYPYNGLASSGSNLGPTNPVLMAMVKARIEVLRAADPGNMRPIPVDLVTASGSGLDPDISLAAAHYQAARVARARGLSGARVERLIHRYAQGRTLGFLGEPRVNVLRLNLALDRLSGKK